MSRFSLRIFSAALILAAIIGQTGAGAENLRIRRPAATSTSFAEPGNNNTSIFQTFVAPAAREVPPPAVNIVEDTRATTTSFQAQLSRQELSQLSQRDIIFIVDQSGSMTTRDCPAPPAFGDARRWGSTFGRAGAAGKISRWQWTEQELIRMATRSRGGLPNGLTLDFFASTSQSFPGVHAREIPYIFQRREPDGSTNAAEALQCALDRYFQNKAAFRGRVRPAAIIFITDGVPSSASNLRKVIIDASRNLQYPKEIMITFLQIGTASGGTRLLQELDDKLLAQGASFDIVDAHSFSEVQQLGLDRAIIAALNESGIN